MPSLSSFCAVEKPLKPFSIRKAVMPRGPRVGIGLGVDHQHVGAGAVGDPELGAVEDVAVALLLGLELHRHHVGAGARLGHGERADVLARDQLGQVLALLRVGAVAADLVDAQVGVRAVGQPDRGRAAADLLHGDAVLEIAQPRAAVLLLHRDAVQARARRASATAARGNSLVLSISAASGAISSAVKPRTLARSWSAVSPRSKLSVGKSLGIMERFLPAGLPSG